MNYNKMIIDGRVTVRKNGILVPNLAMTNILKNSLLLDAVYQSVNIHLKVGGHSFCHLGS